MIRRGTPFDADWIRDTAAHVYAALGDYGRVIPGWMAHPGVVTWVEARDDAPQIPRGFILLGFYAPLTEGSSVSASQGRSDSRRPGIAIPTGELVGDLLAIAVAPEHQRQGVGTTLLNFAIDLVAQAAEQAPVTELRLTVADTNDGAKRLFAAHGFEVLDSYHGSYDGGQRAIRMRRRVH